MIRMMRPDSGRICARAGSNTLQCLAGLLVVTPSRPLGLCRIATSRWREAGRLARK
jgi:hypothetical protein